MITITAANTAILATIPDMRALRVTTIASSALLAVLFAGGCTSSLIYPPTAGKALARPDVSPCPELMSDAMFVVARTNKNTTEECVIFNLPTGVQSTVWNKVQTRLGSRAAQPVRAMTASDTVAFSVEQIRLNGGKAEVDVLYVDRGVWQLATVHFTGGAFASYASDGISRWVIPANAPTANDPRPAEAAAIAQVQSVRDAQNAARANAAAVSVVVERTEVASEESAAAASAPDAQNPN